MMKSITTLWLIALLLVCADGLAQGIYPGDAVRINDETISYQRFQGFYIEYRNSQGVAVGARGDQLDLLTRLRREAMDLLIEQVLVAQAAAKAGVETDPAEVEKAFADLRSIFPSDQSFEMKLKGDGFTADSLRRHLGRMMAAQTYLNQVRARNWDVTDEDLEQYYHDNEYRLTLPEQVRVRHILLTWKPMGKPDDRAFIREQMQPILERARAGEDFAAMARELSDDYATRQSGGDTGFFHRGQMTKAFEDAAFALEPNEISDVVESPFGVHIIKLLERQHEELLAFEDIRDQLRQHVSDERAEEAVQDLIQALKDKAEIEILIPLGRSDEQDTN